jgi:hypothetical protein
MSPKGHFDKLNDRGPHVSRETRSTPIEPTAIRIRENISASSMSGTPMFHVKQHIALIELAEIRAGSHFEKLNDRACHVSRETRRVRRSSLPRFHLGAISASSMTVGHMFHGRPAAR